MTALHHRSVFCVSYIANMPGRFNLVRLYLRIINGKLELRCTRVTRFPLVEEAAAEFLLPVLGSITQGDRSVKKCVVNFQVILSRNLKTGMLHDDEHSVVANYLCITANGRCGCILYPPHVSQETATPQTTRDQSITPPIIMRRLNSQCNM